MVFVALGMLIGVLNFAPGDPGFDYAIKPSATELRSLGNRLAHDLRAAGSPARHIDAMCADAACARRVGAAHHVSRVVFSSATREMAMIWTAQASVVDVATGQVSGPYDIGYKGDYEAIRAGLDALASALVPVVDKPQAVAHVKH